MSDIRRCKRIENISLVKNVGIVFTVGDEQQWNILYQYVKRFTTEGRSVWLAGFQGQKTTINYIFSHPHSVICHEKEDTNMWGIPKEETLHQFLSLSYDLLIDTTANDDFFGNYVAAKAHADLKVTYVNDVEPLSHTSEKIFDLLIHGNKPLELEEFFEETIKYLSMIKK